MSIHAQKEPPARQANIAVLGSTGFLGPCLVAALLRKHNQSRIVCLNRCSDGEERTIRLYFVATDITKPLLGLGPALYEILASDLNEVTFNAWNTNWSTPLERFEPLVCALRSAIHACTTSPQKPRLTYISSTSALANWPKLHPEQPLLPEEPAWDKASATRDAYGQSKQMAEQTIAQAHAERHLRAAIVSADLIGGHSSQPRSLRWPIQGSVYVLIKASQKMGKWPTQANALDWIPVDTLAEGIARTTITPLSDDRVCVYNMMHPTPVPSLLLYNTPKNQFGLTAKQVGLSEWLKDLSPKCKLHAFLQEEGTGREQEGMLFRNENALRVLPDVENITELQLAA